MAPGASSWQSTGMPTVPDPLSPPDPPRRAGGCLIAAGLVLGPVVGLLFGQVSLGLVIGFGLGVAAAVAMTLIDRR
jgi:hypothetical protein